MADQVTNGKAFEWAVAEALKNATGFPIVEDELFEKNKQYYSKISEKKKSEFVLAANKSVAHILLRESSTLENKLFQIIFVKDARGEDGDVRDIILFNADTSIGISCKTNHDDLKHSRLSDKLDFVKKWGLLNTGCSKVYWDKIKPIFAELRKIKKDSNRNFLFDELENKADRFYWPVLDAFSEELESLFLNESIDQDNLSKNLVSYLIGKNDFYKIIAARKDVTIQGFNFNNSLKIPRSKFPKEILAIDRKNGGSYSKTIRFSGGYSINFRIHSAKKTVEPSLKFAIKAIAFPPKEIYTQNILLK